MKKWVKAENRCFSLEPKKNPKLKQREQWGATETKEPTRFKMRLKQMCDRLRALQILP
jgi:hypothetical protein